MDKLGEKNRISLKWYLVFIISHSCLTEDQESKVPKASLTKGLARLIWLTIRAVP